MSAPKPWTAAEEQRLVDLHAQGVTLCKIATTLNRSKQSVSKHAKAAGLKWDRAQTASATNARVEDNKARRSIIESDLLVEVQRLLTQTKAPHVVFHWNDKNECAEHTLKGPTTGDIRNLMQSVGIAIDKSLKLSVYDGTGGDGGAAVDAWLVHMTSGGPGPMAPVAYM
jgi:hypothetical protein